MAVSEVIEEFIRRNPGSRESDAFERFLDEPRIRQWVGDDASRRERLRREFTRVWANLHPGGGGAPASAVTTPRPPFVQHEAPAPPREAPRTLRVDVRPDPAARRLQLLCPACTRVDVWLQAGVVSCRSCGRVYDDMLSLVPVKAVGPFAYVFGEGAKGILTATGIGLLLLAVYGVLKWV